jgi:hypothetical protein
LFVLSIVAVREAPTMPVRRRVTVYVAALVVVASVLSSTASASATAAGRPLLLQPGPTQIPPSDPPLIEETSWYQLVCVWSVCETNFKRQATEAFAAHGYMAMLQFDIWHPQVRVAISLYGPFIDALADQALVNGPDYTIQTVTSMVEWHGYSITLFRTCGNTCPTARGLRS